MLLCLWTSKCLWPFGTAVRGPKQRGLGEREDARLVMPLERTGHLVRLPSGHSDFNGFSYLMEKNLSGPCSVVTKLFARIKRVGFLHVNLALPHVPFPCL